MKSLINLGLASVFIVGLTNSMFAQSSGSTTGAISGQVKDSQAAIISGATVSLKHIETNLERVIQTNYDGSYLIVQLPPGNYE
ncbi:MAG: carboxypeptidase-like regulatory domain-containing protein, partial [Blastocatellia bacterium]